MRMVLDTNVLVAAFASGGLCRELLRACLRSHQVFLSEFILDELAQPSRRSSACQPQSPNPSLILCGRIANWFSRPKSVTMPVAILMISLSSEPCWLPRPITWSPATRTCWLSASSTAVRSYALGKCLTASGNRLRRREEPAARQRIA